MQQTLYCPLVSVYINYVFQTSDVCPIHLFLMQSLCHVLFYEHIHKLATYYVLIIFPSPSLSDLGADSHAGGAGDLLRAAAAKAAEEDVLPEEREAEGPPRHFGARPAVLLVCVQTSRVFSRGQ